MDTNSDMTGGNDLPQAERKHPQEWQRDLNPSHMAGQNAGEQSADLERGIPTAYDVKEVHRTLHDQFDDTELKQIPILPAGQRLQQGATYLDLHDPRREEFTAMGGMSAGDGQWCVPKDEVPYSLWNRLRGVEDPQRIAERPDDSLNR